MREIWPVFVVLLILLLITAAVTTGVVLLMPGREVSIALIYRIDPRSGTDPSSVDVRALVDAVQRRVNPGPSRHGRVRTLEDGSIEIGLFSDAPAEQQRIERLLQTVGRLEFHLPVNGNQRTDLAQQARRKEDSDLVRDPAGQVLAKWLPVRAGLESGFRGRGIVRRNDDRGNSQVLVLEDGCQVSNQHLLSAQPRTENLNRHHVELVLDQRGAEGLQQLIGRDFPGPVYLMQNGDRALGIAIDGQLHSATPIEDVTFNRVQITGPFTRQDVETLATLLGAGPLPVPLQQVEKRQVPTRQ